MKLHKYTESELRSAVSSSISIRQALQKLGVTPQGGNYHVFNKAILYFNIDTSHFTGMNLSGRKLPTRRQPLEKYLSNEIFIQSNKLRKYLIEAGILKAVCSSCELELWLNNPIPLELDHIDGNHQNNSLDNLRLLCPNCHALTPTYRGKNKRRS